MSAPTCPRITATTRPTIFRIWCIMKLWPLTLIMTNSIPSRTKGWPHYKNPPKNPPPQNFFLIPIENQMGKRKRRKFHSFSYRNFSHISFCRILPWLSIMKRKNFQRNQILFGYWRWRRKSKILAEKMPSFFSLISKKINLHIDGEIVEVVCAEVFRQEDIDSIDALQWYAVIVGDHFLQRSEPEWRHHVLIRPGAAPIFAVETACCFPQTYEKIINERGIKLEENTGKTLYQTDECLREVRRWLCPPPCWTFPLPPAHPEWQLLMKRTGNCA